MNLGYLVVPHVNRGKSDTTMSTPVRKTADGAKTFALLKEGGVGPTSPSRKHTLNPQRASLPSLMGRNLPRQLKMKLPNKTYSKCNNLPSR